MQWSRFFRATLWLGLMAAGGSLAGAEDAVPEAAAMAPLLEAHCFDCHGNGVREGDLALDELLAIKDSAAARPQWLNVWKMVRQGFMPPADFSVLDSSERQQLTHCIESETLGVDRERRDPGRVTMRRLNRVEYEFSVFDLFGVGKGSTTSATTDWRLREMLPPDDTAYGFDNIGDFQTLPPALLERYFEIAEYVVDNVLVVEGPWYPKRRYDDDRFRTRHREKGDSKRTVQTLEFRIDEPGEYRVEVEFRLGGWQEYGGEYRFEYRVDDATAAEEVIDVGGEKEHRYRHEGPFTAGNHSVRLQTESLKPDSEGNWNHLALDPQVIVTGPISADRTAVPDSHRRIFFDGEPPPEADARRTYARAVLERVASRAFRRPVDAVTVDRLTQLAMASDDFERGVANSLIAILTSPRFLFRTELQPEPDDPAVHRELDEYSLASRLSYLLWLSLPDKELMQLAEEGRLRDELPAQLKRMLADRKSDRFFEDFAGQWLRTRNVLMTSISRDEEVVDPVRGDMKRETELLFEHIARHDCDLRELITADYSFLNEQLAAYYDIEGVEGDNFRRVELPAESHRGGILTHASFLVSTSNPDRTSPVKRGLFVLDNLLATQPPAPPANVPPLEQAKHDGAAELTVRQQLEAHRADPSCAACHAHFDPIGIVLENYNLIGQWREEEDDAPIDPRATTTMGDELATIEDLRKYIADDRDRFYRCCTEKLLTYALGRGLEPYDSPTVDEIAASLAADDGKFSTLLWGVVESPAFQSRRGDDNASLTTEGMTIPKAPPPEQRRRNRFEHLEERARERRRREREEADSSPQSRESRHADGDRRSSHEAADD